MSYLDILEAQLTLDEGKRNKMYLDSLKVPTIGIGHNLRDVPISDRGVRAIFEDDMYAAEGDARKLVKTFDDLSDARKAVVVNMAFNLGYRRFAAFSHTIRMIEGGFFDAAADAMLDSLWAKQVGERAVRLADAMRKG